MLREKQMYWKRTLVVVALAGIAIGVTAVAVSIVSSVPFLATIGSAAAVTGVVAACILARHSREKS
jgi:uncharacterized membrane protein HdeD (DUF308 family)